MRARLKSPFAPILAFCCYLLACDDASAQYELRGTVTDKTSGETIIGAIVKLKGEAKGEHGQRRQVHAERGATPHRSPSRSPAWLLLAGRSKWRADQPIRASMGADEVMLKEALVVKERISDKQKQAPLTVETMDLIAIKEAPTGDFYQGLGTLKGVDMVAASFGFKVINTRGFSTKPGAFAAADRWGGQPEPGPELLPGTSSVQATWTY